MLYMVRDSTLNKSRKLHLPDRRKNGKRNLPRGSSFSLTSVAPFHVRASKTILCMTPGSVHDCHLALDARVPRQGMDL